MLFYSSAEIAYGEENALKRYSTFSVDAGIQRVPIMLWVKFVSESDLSPFLRMGIGGAKTDYRMIADNFARINVRFHQWQFCTALSGGFNYTINRSFSMEIFIDDVITFSEMTMLSPYSNETYGLFSSYSLTLGGIRMLYTL